MDATPMYRMVEHRRDRAVEGLLSMFEVGGLRRPAFRDNAVEASFDWWVRALNVRGA
jgi:hypothetical protein